MFFEVGAFGSDTAVISGKVTIEQSLLSIYDAKVYLYNAHREIIDSTLSTQSGGFAFVLTAGDYYLSAENGNFVREYYPGAYEISEANKIRISPGENISIYFNLDRGGWLGGTFNYFGREIEKGLVTAIKIDEPYAGWNKSITVPGQRPVNYVLNGLLPGAYKVAGMASAKKTLYFPGVENFEDAGIIYVERNSGVPNISFLLEPVGTGQVSGRAYDIVTGVGLSGIPVFAYQWRDFWSDPNMQSVLTGEDGSFVFDLPEGNYNFYLNCDNCIPGSGRIAFYYNNRYNPMLADKVEVQSGAAITGLDFAIDLGIPHDLSISGNIIDLESGMGINDVIVTAIDYLTGDAISSTYSISSGDYALENLPSGKYLLQYSGSNVIPFFYRSSAYWQNAEPIILNVDHSGIENEAITQDYGNLGLAVSGNVSNPEGPVSGARVYAIPVGIEQPIAYGYTDALGDYSITTGLENGFYHIVCDMFGYYYSIFPFDIYLDLHENPTMENVDFLLQPVVTAVTDEVSSNVPDKIEILANYPNPFNNVTKIPIFSGSDVSVNVNLEVFNILGQKEGVKSVTLQPGLNYIEWRGEDFRGGISSGIYFYRLEGSRKTRKMVFLK
jgi:hypothetical protein